MPDDLTNRGTADRSRVNVHERHEIDYWTRKWGCSETELRAAVEATGSVIADKIEAQLKSKGQKRT
jgi:hypothetical protein